MIYASLTDAPAYRGIHPRLDRVLELLTPEFLASVGTTRREIDGEDLFVTRFDVSTSDDPERLFEYHRRYLDVFVTVRGRERVDIASPEAVALQVQQGDYWGGSARAEQSVVLCPGRFLVLFPGDAHRPGSAAERPEEISRIVFKILI
ncbi:MAG: YhcH/YjgK/YiaL family protein [Oscillospiraceae bacterium]|nr:YhcH/YjgK/YiaL family protein [Oscillospiraceae bacterium]